MKIGIIGDKKSILAFRALGLETFGVANEQDFTQAIQKAKDFAVLFLLEKVAEKYKKNLSELYQKTLPAVLIIPEQGDLAKEELKKIVERALGSDKIAIN